MSGVDDLLAIPVPRDFSAENHLIAHLKTTRNALSAVMEPCQQTRARWSLRPGWNRAAFFPSVPGRLSMPTIFPDARQNSPGTAFGDFRHLGTIFVTCREETQEIPDGYDLSRRQGFCRTSPDSFDDLHGLIEKDLFSGRFEIPIGFLSRLRETGLQRIQQFQSVENRPLFFLLVLIFPVLETSGEFVPFRQTTGPIGGRERACSVRDCT